MLKSLFDTQNNSYRKFLFSYVLKYHSNLRNTKEIYLLTTNIIHYYKPLFITNSFIDIDSDDNGCCGEGIYKRCPSQNTKAIEKLYSLDKIDVSAWGMDNRYEKWTCFGWVNFNFRSPKMKMAFQVNMVNRILKEHYHQIHNNKCSDCGRIKRTPKAKHCMWCI